MNSTYRKAKEILEKNDITLNGNKPWDVQIHNKNVFNRWFSEGSMGMGESYMDGRWDAKELDKCIYKLYYENLEKHVSIKGFWKEILKAKLMNRQTKKKSHKVAKEHYDLGNDFYENMLDSRMQYTCGYWKKAKTLEQAQKDKLDLVCKKLKLKKGEKVLEIGCGWGGFAKYAAENYGVEVTCYNISKEQVEYARKNTKGLPVTVHLADYREAKGEYDKVAAIGIAEHVGYKNYKGMMKIAHRCLKKHGLFIVHTIANNFSTTRSEPWFDTYIFPNGMLPSAKQLAEALEGIFVLEDWHNFGPDYDKTLMAWFTNFNKNWPKFQKRYGDRFYKMWKFYLLSFAGNFRARKIELYQLVLSKNGILGGYSSVR